MNAKEAARKLEPKRIRLRKIWFKLVFYLTSSSPVPKPSEWLTNAKNKKIKNKKKNCISNHVWQWQSICHFEIWKTKKKETKFDIIDVNQIKFRGKRLSSSCDLRLEHFTQRSMRRSNQVFYFNPFFCLCGFVFFSSSLSRCVLRNEAQQTDCKFTEISCINCIFSKIVPFSFHNLCVTVVEIHTANIRISCASAMTIMRSHVQQDKLKFKCKKNV